jgi:hypothetical protein
MNGNKKNQNGGYVLLITVLISSVILAMTLGMANTAYREETFAIQAKESYIAFFAADTGLECALAADRVAGSPFDGPNPVIRCADQSITTIGDTSPADVEERVYDFEIASAGVTIPDGGCAHIIVRKNAVVNTLSGLRGTIIESRGYNLPCDETDAILISGSGDTRLLVERALRATYYAAPAAPPPGGPSGPTGPIDLLGGN